MLGEFSDVECTSCSPNAPCETKAVEQQQLDRCRFPDQQTSTMKIGTRALPKRQEMTVWEQDRVAQKVHILKPSTSNEGFAEVRDRTPSQVLHLGLTSTLFKKKIYIY